MTKLIAIFIVLVVLFIGYEMYQRWEAVQNVDQGKQSEAQAPVQGESLPGLPYQLIQSLQKAQQQGPGAFRKWLQAYDGQLQDPRKAWIELDYCVAISRDDLAEARRVFAAVRDRTPQSSPVWSRIQQMQRSFE